MRTMRTVMVNVTQEHIKNGKRGGLFRLPDCIGYHGCDWLLLRGCHGQVDR